MIVNFIHLLPHLLCILMCTTFSGALRGQGHMPFTTNRSLSWEESIDYYTELDRKSEFARLLPIGSTDVGKPLHLFVVDKEQRFEPELLNREKTIVLINNSIHPGEPDGADACAWMCNELLDPSNPLHALLDSVILCIIPVYNVDGALRRNSTTRANQEGPEVYGFRGNARNLDLNRDFIKCDSENARSFSRLFTRLKPHVFVDTHVSNGADYPYTMTLITTQVHKLGGAAGEYLRGVMEPALFRRMEEKGEPMSPYVHTMGRTPESGLVDFPDTPRFSTGYAALYNTLGFVTETHMLKPFPQRVQATYLFLTSLLDHCNRFCHDIILVRQKADDEMRKRKELPLRYELDSAFSTLFRFRGYAPLTEPAKVGKGNRLRYDRDSIWEGYIPHFRKYHGANVVRIPKAYVLPQAWHEVILRLKANNVLMTRIPADTVLTLTCTFVDDYSTPNRPYEGHYPHSNVKVRREQRNVTLYTGDWIIYTDQPARRYLVETLEPAGEDSFFTWNFFDSALQQKEWFSDYVFEEKAEELLRNDAVLRKAFEQAIAEDEALRDNHWQQLYWIYKRSPYYEGTAGMMPVYRLE
jgi:hypothetical protein